MFVLTVLRISNQFATPSMSAINLYITTCRYVIQSNPQDPESWVELYKYLPYLRQALSCCVCTQVFHCPMGPVESKCQHHVCKECVGGKMRLKPQCGWCNNFDDFVEKPQLRIVVQCFKKLCEYIASSAVSLHLASSCTNSVGTVSGNQLLSIIQEAVAIKDDNTNIPNSINKILPPPTLQKVDNVPGTSVSTVSFISSCKKRTGRFKRKRKSAFGRPKIVAPFPDRTLTNDTGHCGKEEPMKAENGVATSNGNCSQDNEPNDQTVHYSPKQNSHKQLFITDTVKAEHDYIKELPVESDDRHVRSRSRKHSGHGSSVDQVLNFKSKTEQPVNMNNGSSQIKTHSTTTACESIKSKSHNKTNRSQSYGCRCGLATPKPGNLTCCGQRCPCYSAFKGCESCKCRGCRNPRGDPATNPLAAMRLQRQFQNVHVIQTPISQLGGIDMSPPLLPITTGLVDDELDINIDI